MARLGTRAVLSVMAVLTTALGLWPVPALADGGPIVDPALFSRLTEGQQIAVVTINDLHTASVDLFVSILDQTGESHDITYFVPLGVNPGRFSVNQENSISFGNELTNGLDTAIFSYNRENQDFLDYLFAGALLTNGAWLTPVWVPILLSGCGAASVQEPLSTFKTDSSEVSVFSIDQDTDVEALASTAGLAPSVTDTLSRLRGQQIAVIRLHTMPRPPDTASAGPASATGEPGLHLSWDTSLTQSKSGSIYTYPLGTGVAWANPIVMTRVYVVAPPNLHFNVNYPKLGVNRSGVINEGNMYVARILDAGGTPAYAVESASNQLMNNSYSYPLSPWRVNVWRVTYANSNAAQDITITVHNGPALSALGTRLRKAGSGQAFLLGLLVAAVLWVLVWWLLMPRLLGGDIKAHELLGTSLGYLGISLGLFIPGAIAYFISSTSSEPLDGLVITVPVFAAASLFILDRLNHHGVKTWRAIRSLGILTLASGGAYVLFVLAYAGLIGAL